MKKTTKQTFVALALAGAFSSAQAATTNLTAVDFPYDLGADPTDADVYSVTHQPESFSDIFTFSLSTLSDSVSSAVSLLLPGVQVGDPSSYEIDNGLLSLWSDPDANGASVGDVLLGQVAYSEVDGILTRNSVAAGSYYWAVAGDAVGSNGGIYTFAANTAPIPEPETYAMMLAGLGMLGFVGKRRMKTSRQSLNFA